MDSLTHMSQKRRFRILSGESEIESGKNGAQDDNSTDHTNDTKVGARNWKNGNITLKWPQSLYFSFNDELSRNVVPSGGKRSHDDAQESFQRFAFTWRHDICEINNECGYDQR